MATRTDAQQEERLVPIMIRHLTVMVIAGASALVCLDVQGQQSSTFNDGRVDSPQPLRISPETRSQRLPVLIPAQLSEPQSTGTNFEPSLQQPTFQPRTSPRADDPVPQNRRVPDLPATRPNPLVPKRDSHFSRSRPYEKGLPKSQVPRRNSRYPVEQFQPHPSDQRFYSDHRVTTGCANCVCTETTRRRGLLGLNLVGRFKDRLFGSGSCHCPDCQIERVPVAKEPPCFAKERFEQAQIGRGQQAEMIFHCYDFQPDTAKLNVGGLRRASRVVPMLPTNVFPVVVESSRNTELDERRRTAVKRALTTAGFPVPIERVLAQRPLNRNLQGADIQILEQRRRMHSLQSNDPALPSIDPILFDRIK